MWILALLIRQTSFQCNWFTSSFEVFYVVFELPPTIRNLTCCCFCEGPSLDKAPILIYQPYDKYPDTRFSFYHIMESDKTPIVKAGLPMYFLDHGGIRTKLEEWLDRLAWLKENTSPSQLQLVPLFLNGLVKVGFLTTSEPVKPENLSAYMILYNDQALEILHTGEWMCTDLSWRDSLQTGKTHVITHVLPALIAAHPVFGKSGSQKAMLWSLDFSQLGMDGDYRDNLAELL